jgi:hypothetical protein
VLLDKSSLGQSVEKLGCGLTIAAILPCPQGRVIGNVFYLSQMHFSEANTHIKGQGNIPDHSAAIWQLRSKPH